MRRENRRNSNPSEEKGGGDVMSKSILFRWCDIRNLPPELRKVVAVIGPDIPAKREKGRFLWTDDDIGGPLDMCGLLATIGKLLIGVDELVIRKVERHQFDEAFVSLKGKSVYVLAPPTDDDKLPKVLWLVVVPSGTIVVLRKRVWHFVPFSLAKRRRALVAVFHPSGADKSQTKEVEDLEIPFTA